MKKLLFSIGLILTIVISANAQPEQRARRRLQPRISDNIGEIRLHVGGEIGFPDITGLFIHETPYHYSAGCLGEYQIARCLSLGMGTEFYAIRHINSYKYFSKGDYLNSVPIFGNVKINTTGFTRFFVEIQVGYAIPLNQIPINQSDGTHILRIQTQAKGFFSGSALGISFYGNNISVGFKSVDIFNAETHQHIYTGKNRKLVATDCYLRYSYAFPLN